MDWTAFSEKSKQYNIRQMAFAEATIAALVALGVTATIQKQVVQDIHGVTYPDYLTFIFAGQGRNFEYTLSESDLSRFTPATYAALLVSKVQWDLNYEQVHSGRDKSSSSPTGSMPIESTSGQSSTGVTDTTATGSAPSSTPASGTVPTTPERTGLARELQAAIEANSMDASATYNGYEWAWFYARTPSYAGYPMGPSELGIEEAQVIGIDDATKKIAAYLGSRSTSQQNTGTPEHVAGDGVDSSGSSRAGIAFQLEQVLKASSYSTANTYDGYQWAYFFAQTTGYKGQTMGPTELGLNETQQVGLDEAARRIESFVAGGTSGGAGGSGNGGNGQTGTADSKTLLIMGGIALAGVFLARMIAR